ncbi:translation initiation factor IF-2-like [Elephas maximus indicus]|uniref:translation initiation factor IF-2-like n=1 Tax=Elephas maximus indicus TaxID=99487 RepID=UPI002115E36B|nr:translation initiation factor IF-2-like [Elephas maximus indicus]
MHYLHNRVKEKAQRSHFNKPGPTPVRPGRLGVQRTPSGSQESPGCRPDPRPDHPPRAQPRGRAASAALPGRAQRPTALPGPCARTATPTAAAPRGLLTGSPRPPASRPFLSGHGRQPHAYLRAGQGAHARPRRGASVASLGSWEALVSGSPSPERGDLGPLGLPRRALRRLCIPTYLSKPGPCPAGGRRAGIRNKGRAGSESLGGLRPLEQLPIPSRNLGGLLISVVSSLKIRSPRVAWRGSLRPGDKEHWLPPRASLWPCFGAIADHPPPPIYI